MSLAVTSAGSGKSETLACLVIDDPLLRPRYGCLDYQKLLAAMQRHHFFTEIAFIPWNFARSDQKTVKLFADNGDCLALCIHGCNHTANEFGGSDEQQLIALSTTALWRMEQHKKRTGLPYDPVMVFPQGRFSSAAMKTLKHQGYLAAFNSTIRAKDAGEPPAAEFLKPATMFYHDFPLFLRRYPNDRNGFLQDYAVGRPLIIVEHHGAFRNGVKAVTNFVDWINSLGKIRWTSLANIAEYYLRTRPGTPGQSARLSSMGRLFDAKIALRQLLSEARDYYVETNDILTNLYKAVRR